MNISPAQNTLNQEDLFRILLAQLQYQDPLKPIDNQQFMGQLAQFSALEQSRQTNDKLDKLMTVTAATQSIGLIGKTVAARSDSGADVEGTVGSIVFDNGVPRLTITNFTGAAVAEVSLSQIYRVR